MCDNTKDCELSDPPVCAQLDGDHAGICFRPKPEATESPAPSGQAEFDLLSAVVAEAKKVHKESAAVVRNKQNSEEARWGASLRADTCQTLITVLERVKTTGI